VNVQADFAGHILRFGQCGPVIS